MKKVFIVVGSLMACGVLLVACFVLRGLINRTVNDVITDKTPRYNINTTKELLTLPTNTPIPTKMPDKVVEGYPMPSDEWVNTYATDYILGFMGGCMGTQDWVATDANAMCCYCMGAKIIYNTTELERASSNFISSDKVVEIMDSCAYLYNK